MPPCRKRLFGECGEECPMFIEFCRVFTLANVYHPDILEQIVRAEKEASYCVVARFVKVTSAFNGDFITMTVQEEGFWCGSKKESVHQLSLAKIEQTMRKWQQGKVIRQAYFQNFLVRDYPPSKASVLLHL